MRTAPADVDGSSQLRALDDVWIPNRNGVFLNIAASFAESYDCAVVVTGFNREEAVEFPDNSADYVDSVNESLKYSTRNGVEVVSPTLGLTKREIILDGIEARAPLSVIWSCYREGPVMCGECGSCEKLRVALLAVPDDKRPVIEFSS
jgi:7-cyano-7-deazaguanine synthase